IFLSQGLAALTARMEPGEAARACRQAVPTLLQAMTTGHGMGEEQARIVLIFAGHLEPNEAVQVCGQAAAILLEVISRTADPATPRHDALQGLSLLLSREGSTATRQLSVTVMVAGPGGSGTPLAALAGVPTTLEPLLPPLPAQTLVDLLKN